jgi:triosephosphate isomerase
MIDMFVNLKRFDVPLSMGGICSFEDPVQWAQWVVDESARIGLGHIPDVRICVFFPEALLPAVVAKAATYGKDELGNVAIGSQGVFRADVGPGGNFGAFTTNLPAAAARNLGCTWAIIGHSEERADQFEIVTLYDPNINSDPASWETANRALHTILNRETMCAFERGLNVLFCVGETAEERGEGPFEVQQPRIREVLDQQLSVGLAGAGQYLRAGLELVIAYEPRWAIGPGKTPPGPDYVEFVSNHIKVTARNTICTVPKVLYGGGLKRENAAAIAGVTTVDGGLVALTKFTQPVAFDPEEFKVIIEMYLSGNKHRDYDRRAT